MKNKAITIITTFTFLLVLFLFPVSAFTGAKNGLLLWFQTVLPTLLPFVILSNLIVALDLTSYITLFFYPLFKKIFGVSKYGSYPIVIGMLSGYPLGAKTCADLVKTNQISKGEGQFLLSLCNNASPMFITSYIGMQCLGIKNNQYLLLVIIYLSTIINAFLYRLNEKIVCKFQKNSLYHPSNYSTVTANSKTDTRTTFQILDDSIMNAFEILTKIGGYIILFSLAAQIIYDIPALPHNIKILLVGIFEITTGTNAIALSTYSQTIKIILILTFTAFGGLSSLAQTKSVIADSGLSIKTYFVYKISNGIIAGFITYFWILFN
jgi:Uncharacterized protein conserved in bacteria